MPDGSLYDGPQLCKAVRVHTGTTGAMDAYKGAGPSAVCCQTVPAGQAALTESSITPRGQATAGPAWLVTTAVASLPPAGVYSTNHTI